MKSKHSRFLLVALVPVALGGCTSLFGGRFVSEQQGLRAGAEARQDVITPGTRASATQEGRAHLTNGQPGLAIEAFQRALAGGEQVAQALNGMGVAYARIGRKDLAVRYFEQALAADPQNVQFAQNLDRTYRTMSPLRTGQIVVADQSPPLENPHAKSALAGAIPAASARRSTRPEIQIVTRADLPRAGQRITNLESRFQPLVRVEFSRLSPKAVNRELEVSANFKPVVRINLENIRRSNLPEVQVAAAGVRLVK